MDGHQRGCGNTFSNAVTPSVQSLLSAAPAAAEPDWVLLLRLAASGCEILADVAVPNVEREQLSAPPQLLAARWPLAHDAGCETSVRIVSVTNLPSVGVRSSERASPVLQPAPAMG